MNIALDYSLMLNIALAVLAAKLIAAIAELFFGSEIANANNWHKALTMVDGMSSKLDDVETHAANTHISLEQILREVQKATNVYPPDDFGEVP